jgi:hypothetical protein
MGTAYFQREQERNVMSSFEYQRFPNPFFTILYVPLVLISICHRYDPKIVKLFASLTLLYTEPEVIFPVYS